MPAAHGPPQDFSAFLVLIASICVVYWRTTLRVAAIVITTLAAYGAVLVIEGLRHAVK